MVLGIEAVASLILHWHDPDFFTPFSVVFHAVSAFCNAGFALCPDNLMAYRDDVVVNVVIYVCIILGALASGCLLYELLGLLPRGRLGPRGTRFSRLSRLVVSTSRFLVLAGPRLLVTASNETHRKFCKVCTWTEPLCPRWMRLSWPRISWLIRACWT